MRLSDVETFCTIVDAGSISNAAAKMFLAQSTVSQRLDRLEQELGGPLLSRAAGVKGIALTAKGEALLPLAKNLLSVSSEIGALSRQNLPVSLSLGSITSIHDSILPELLCAIADDAPAIHLSTQARTTYDLYSKIENRSIQYAFVSFEMQSPIIRCIPVFKEEYKFVCYKGRYPSQKTVNVLDFDESLELYYSWCTEFRLWHETVFSEHAMHYVHVDTLATFAQCLIRSNFWAICPTSAIRFLQTLNIPIDTYEIMNPPNSRTIYLIGRKSRFESPDASDILFKNAFLRFYNNLSRDIVFDCTLQPEYPFMSTFPTQSLSDTPSS